MSDSENGVDLRQTPEYYLVSPPTLKELCSREIVAMAFRYRVINYSRKCKRFLRDIMLKNCSGKYPLFFSLNPNRRLDLNIEDLLGLDKQIVEKIIQPDIIQPICVSIQQWIQFHQQIIREEVILTCLEALVFKPGGSICYLSTAKNLLNGNELNISEKFTLACVNCLGDQVRSMWPSVPKDFRMSDFTLQIFLYWSRVMNRCEERPRDLLYYRFWDATLFRKLPVFEYVFNSLNESQLIKTAIEAIELDAEYFFEYIVLKLNRNMTQLHTLMRQINLRKVLMCMFRNNAIFASTFLKIWNFKKYFISVTEFCDIMFYLIFTSVYHGKVDGEFMFCILFEMWSSVPNHFKDYVLSNGSVDKWFRPLSYCGYGGDMSFFIDVLTKLPPNLRNSIWYNSWTDIILISKPIYLGKVMMLCFTDDEEIILFKEREMMNFKNIERFYLELIQYKNISDLVDYINFCSTDNNKVARLAREIVTSDIVKFVFKMFYTEQDFEATKTLIYMAFKDAQEATKYIRSVLSFEYVRGIDTENRN